MAHVSFKLAHASLTMVHASLKVAHVSLKMVHVTLKVAHVSLKVTHVSLNVAHASLMVAHVSFKGSLKVGGPHGRAVKSAVSKSLDHLTAVSGVGSNPALATCDTSQVLLAGVPGGLSRGTPVFAPPTDWPVSYELK